MILPASQRTDQPFWADIVRRKKLGSAGFLAPSLTPQKLADALYEGLIGAPFCVLSILADHEHNMSTS